MLSEQLRSRKSSYLSYTGQQVARMVQHRGELATGQSSATSEEPRSNSSQGGTAHPCCSFWAKQINLEHQHESTQRSNTVRLVQATRATRIPGRGSVVIRPKVEGNLKEHPAIFHPDAKFMAQTGVQIEGSILSPDDQEQILLP